MGVLIDNDSESPHILSHGNAKSISTKFDRYKVSGLYDHVEALYFPVHPDIIHTLNICVNTSGSAGIFKTFLEKFGAKHPELVPNTRAIANAFA